MQFLLKISLEKTSVWRLIALDGKADLAHGAALICAAFGYRKGKDSFVVASKAFPAGCGGQIENTLQLQSLDELLHSCESLTFMHDDEGNILKHKVVIMRKEEKLSCLIPSVIVGSGMVPQEGVLNVTTIQEFADRDENLSLNIKEATSNMRALGSFRSDVSQALVEAGASPLHFKSI